MTCQLMKPSPRAYGDDGAGTVCAYEFEEPGDIRRDRDLLSPAEFRVAHPNYSQGRDLVDWISRKSYQLASTGGLELGTQRHADGSRTTAVFKPETPVRAYETADSIYTVTTIDIGPGSVEVTHARPKN